MTSAILRLLVRYKFSDWKHSSTLSTDSIRSVSLCINFLCFWSAFLIFFPRTLVASWHTNFFALAIGFRGLLSKLRGFGFLVRRNVVFIHSLVRLSHCLRLGRLFLLCLHHGFCLGESFSSGSFPLSL